MQHEDSPGVREYGFGDCRVDIRSREIRRDGKLVAVEPKAFDLLLYLIAHRDRVVGKDELQQQIWPGVIVTEAALTRCVMKARRAIGDDPIATVHGRGYRFKAEVRELVAGSTPTAVATSGARPSLVVLPFVNISNDPQQEYFSDGITEDIITELSRFRSLFVIARPSAFSYKGRSIKACDIAHELGVAYVVDGSLRRDGDRIRLSVRLVDGESDSQIWAERYDREIEDVFLVQEELAATIAATVGGRVEATRGRRRIGRAEFESYDCLLHAQALYYDFRKDANLEAKSLLERAIEIDPGNARALALLAAVHSMDSWSYWSEDSAESQRQSYELGKRSIELDDTDSLAHALFAEILHDCGEHDLADRHFRRAIEINPNDIAARALFASKLAATGHVDEALEHLAVARRLDPFGLFWIPLIAGSVMYAARRYEESLEALRSMMSPPIEARLIMVAVLARLGRRDEAVPVLESIFRSAETEMPHDPGRRLEDWIPIVRRMRGDPPPRELEHFLESLRMAGWA
jgi:TolB-like protein